MTTQFNIKVYKNDRLLKTDLIMVTCDHNPDTMLTATVEVYNELFPGHLIDVEVSTFEKDTKEHKVTHQYIDNVLTTH